MNGPKEKSDVFDRGMSLPESGIVFLRSMDGFVFVCICTLSLIFFFDLSFNFNFVSLRDIENPAKAISLLIASPIIVLFIMIRFRQLPFSNTLGMRVCRAIASFILFYLINF